MTAYFALAHYLFSPMGGDIQSKIIDLIMERLDWIGMAMGRRSTLDVGMLRWRSAWLKNSLKPPSPVSIIGGRIGIMAGAFESKTAGLEGVENHVTFQKASAASLP